MSIFQRIANRFREGIQDNFHVTFAGLDDAGKTSLLYLLQREQLIVTIPTVGSHVETVRPPTLSNDGTVHKASVEMVVWDVSIRGWASQAYFQVLRIHAKSGDALVWMVNSIESDRFRESVDGLRSALERIEREEPDSLKAKQRPLLILANKQDLSNAKPLDEIRGIFADILASRPLSAIFPTSLVRGLGVESGLPQAFDWLRDAIKLSRERAQYRSDHMRQVPALPPHRTQELNNWFSRLKEDMAPETLLKQFEDASLSSWDHYLKIRVMFHVLRKYGRQEGTRDSIILKGFEKGLSLKDGSVRESPNVTMTCFWVQIVHFGISNTRSLAQETSEGKPGPRTGDFIRFLAANPYVVDDALWMGYYSEELMKGQDAINGMVLPDKKPLPSIIFS